MNDSWDARKKAMEEQYFKQENDAALNRLSQRGAEERRCPVTGDALEQVTSMGVVIDRCPKCEGIWLDAGELEQILSGSKKDEENFIGSFLKGIFGK